MPPLSGDSVAFGVSPSARGGVYPAPSYRPLCPDKRGSSAHPPCPPRWSLADRVPWPGHRSHRETPSANTLRRAGSPPIPPLAPHPPPGTRIIYDRKFLLDRRNSPMAQTPPCHLPNIPGVTSPGSAAEEPKADANSLNHQEGKPSSMGDDAQFEMDI
ncbi:eukaryotic translation initiation factor 4E binding protein 2 [Columba livia]|uniref:Eukaryotic translation initiation factor 4E binding protein 2 n=2 Tax=Columba livia TaxID=8932 RepID=A0A2I0MF03_COLLI|nr:eukaryotic translation initiation factor 4E binding protein 2 [Columba livia]